MGALFFSPFAIESGPRTKSACTKDTSRANRLTMRSLPTFILLVGSLVACGAPGSNSSGANAAGGSVAIDQFGEFKLGTPRTEVRGTPVNLQEVRVEKAMYHDIKLNDVVLRFTNDHVHSIATSPRDILTCPKMLEHLVEEWGKPTHTEKVDGIISEWQTGTIKATHIDQPQKGVCTIEVTGS